MSASKQTSQRTGDQAPAGQTCSSRCAFHASPSKNVQGIEGFRPCLDGFPRKGLTTKTNRLTCAKLIPKFEQAGKFAHQVSFHNQNNYCSSAVNGWQFSMLDYNVLALILVMIIVISRGAPG